MTAPGACAADAENGTSRDGLLRAQNRILRRFRPAERLRTEAPQQPRARAAAEPLGSAAEALPQARSGGRVTDTTERKSS